MVHIISVITFSFSQRGTYGNTATIDRLHGKVGTKTLARHLGYDTRIEEEIIDGFAELPPHSQHLIRNRTLFSLKNMELHPKKHWLESVRLARNEYAAPVPPSREQEYTRIIMREFLNHASQSSSTTPPPFPIYLYTLHSTLCLYLHSKYIL